MQSEHEAFIRGKSWDNVSRCVMHLFFVSFRSLIDNNVVFPHLDPSINTSTEWTAQFIRDVYSRLWLDLRFCHLVARSPVTCWSIGTLCELISITHMCGKTSVSIPFRIETLDTTRNGFLLRTRPSTLFGGSAKVRGTISRVRWIGNWRSDGLLPTHRRNRSVKVGPTKHS